MRRGRPRWRAASPRVLWEHWPRTPARFCSAGDIRDVIVRRYTAAWDELRNHAMPAATAVALAAAGLAVSRHRRVLAPVRSDAAWTAALAGGLAAGVVGALAEDSGPVLLV